MKKDLTGQKYGMLQVMYYVGNGKGLWHCRCDCGIEKDIPTARLTSGLVKSCGNHRNRFKDITNQQFGDWTVIKYAGNQLWECKCSCGNIKCISGYDLRAGKSKSCGHRSTAFKDLTGLQIGEWKVIEYTGNQKYLCKCSCGLEKEVDGRSLRNGSSKSCGHKQPLDLTGKVFWNWKALKYAGNHKWLCECQCENHTLREIPSLRLRSGVTKSCGCKKTTNYINTIRDISNSNEIVNISQLHLTEDQLIMTSSRDNVITAIDSNFDCKPTPTQLSNLFGVTPSQVMRIIRKYKLDNLIELYAYTSSYEDELKEIFSSNKCIYHDRSVLNGKELDMYFPDNGLAIEFNGDYWHSASKKDRLYHQNKSLEALKKNVQIIHIFKHEWLDPDTQSKIIQLVDRKLNNQELDVIYARNCNIHKIGYEDAKNFINMYHLQRYSSSSINLGCYFNDRLVGVMTFGEPRFNPKYQYELIRLCWNPEVAVIGGSEKLFSYFVKNYTPKSIISYCDISKFDGHVYKRMEFKLDGITDPNYVWVSAGCNDIKTRYQTRKSILIEKGLGTEDQTENEIMGSLGYTKIYDCGNMRFIWDGGNH